MVVGTFSDEFTTSISPARLWKASVADSHNLLPKILSEHIASIEFVEGNGGPGSIKKVCFTQAVQKLTHVLNRVDVLDEANYVYKYTVIEGNAKYESYCFEIKLEATADGGSVCKISGEYKTAGDSVLTDEETKAGKEGNKQMFKAVEAYLLANPDAYA